MRLRHVQQVVDETARQERSRFVGAVRPVLWEGSGQPLADSSGLLWAGLTDNYLRVATIAPAGDPLRHHTCSPCFCRSWLGMSLRGIAVAFCPPSTTLTAGYSMTRQIS